MLRGVFSILLISENAEQGKDVKKKQKKNKNNFLKASLNIVWTKVTGCSED